MCNGGTDCAVIQNLGTDVGTTSISSNTFSSVGTGILVGASADIVRIENNNSTISLT